MFLRANKRVKDGKTHRYWSVVENRRIAGGRIYERRSDLPPDGKHFIYFAMNGRWDSETKGAWTAISRVPYLKATDLFAKGDCWHGGGLFLSGREFWPNNGHGRPSPPLFFRPPVFAEATTGPPVRPNGSFRGLPRKANSCSH